MTLWVTVTGRKTLNSSPEMIFVPFNECFTYPNDTIVFTPIQNTSLIALVNNTKKEEALKSLL